LPRQAGHAFEVLSLVRLLPLCASASFDADSVTRYPRTGHDRPFRKRHPDLVSHVTPTGEKTISAPESSSVCSQC
jgi:hypothetical protein